MRKEEYLEDEFCHQTILNISDEYWSILVSYPGNDHHQYNVKRPRSIHQLCVKSRMFDIFSSLYN